MVDSMLADRVTLSDDVVAISPVESGVDNQAARPGEDADRERGEVGDAKSAIENPKSAGAVDGGNVPTPLSKREKRRWQREMHRNELKRRRGGKQKASDAAMEEKIRSVEWLLPNISKVLREQLSRSP